MSSNRDRKKFSLPLSPSPFLPTRFSLTSEFQFQYRVVTCVRSQAITDLAPRPKRNGSRDRERRLVRRVKDIEMEHMVDLGEWECSCSGGGAPIIPKLWQRTNDFYGPEAKKVRALHRVCADWIFERELRKKGNTGAMKGKDYGQSPSMCHRLTGAETKVVSRCFLVLRLISWRDDEKILTEILKKLELNVNWTLLLPLSISSLSSKVIF